MSNLLGAINTFFLTSQETAAIALRAALPPTNGVYPFFADVLPQNLPLPFVSVSETATKEVSRVKTSTNGFPKRRQHVTVVFMVFANDRATADNILELLENTFSEAPTGQAGTMLVMADRIHLATYFSNRSSRFDGDASWIGALELTFELLKNAA